VDVTDGLLSLIVEIQREIEASGCIVIDQQTDKRADVTLPGARSAGVTKGS
jgi:hypothetical protein